VAQGEGPSSSPNTTHTKKTNNNKKKNTSSRVLFFWALFRMEILVAGVGSVEYMLSTHKASGFIPSTKFFKEMQDLVHLKRGSQCKVVLLTPGLHPRSWM
jgi:hypothetical protein